MSAIGRALLLAAIAGGCGADGVAGEAVFELPRAATPDRGFSDLPWPNDVYRSPDGTLELQGFPNPSRNATLTAYLDAIASRLDGWGTNGAAYLRFTAPVDEGSLPVSPTDTVAEDATVFLMDVDPRSPERGQRHPAEVRYRDAATLYWPEHTIAIRPVYGIPLAGGRAYAAVVTREVTAADGGRFARSRDFEAVASGGGDAAAGAARALYAPAFEALEAAGVPRDRVLSMAVFTTQDPTAGLIAIRDWMMASYAVPAPVDGDWRWVGEEDGYTHIEGRYGPVPLLQSGEPPYDAPGSGEIRFEGGVPVVSQEVALRFTLTVPLTAMPPTGYPVVLYAHGTGGDFKTFVRNGVAADLAAEGYAALGIDQVLHGERNPTTDSPDFLFFNFLNPYAARDNVRQAVVDVVQQARFVANNPVSTDVIATEAGDPVFFDPSRIYVYGHSQGGLNMPVFLAIDDHARGGLLSGAGGTLAISIIEKKEPLDILLAIKLFLRLPGSTTENAVEREHFTYEHPVLSLLQTWVDAGDGVNYGHLIFHAPRPGFAPKSILQTEGLLDLYTTPHNIEALAASMHNPIAMPVAQPIEALELRGIEPVGVPVTGNVAGGAATAALLQYPDDGHFAAFSNASARDRIRRFFRSFAEGVPTIPAP